MIERDNIYIVLVEPKISENVGFVARLMKNFSFKNLILVNPKIDFEKARIVSTHGREILESSKIIKSINYNDFTIIVGTSGKVSESIKNFRRNYIELEDFVKFLSKIDLKREKVAILFGREDKGLTNEEIDKCDILVWIKASKDYPILNLSHAVGIFLYEINKVLEKEELQEERVNIYPIKKYVNEIIKILEEKNIDMREGFKEKVNKAFFNVLVGKNVRDIEVKIITAFLEKIKKCLEKK